MNGKNSTAGANIPQAMGYLHRAGFTPERIASDLRVAVRTVQRWAAGLQKPNKANFAALREAVEDASRALAAVDFPTPLQRHQHQQLAQARECLLTDWERRSRRELEGRFRRDQAVIRQQLEQREAAERNARRAQNEQRAAARKLQGQPERVETPQQRQERLLAVVERVNAKVGPPPQRTRSITRDADPFVLAGADAEPAYSF